MELNIGDTAPPFELPATDGSAYGPRRRRPRWSSPATTARTRSPGTTGCSRWRVDYQGRGVQVLFVNPNDAVSHPRDSFDAMKERVEADGGWPAPYLRDESQEVARAYGAKTTPDVFVLDAARRAALPRRARPRLRGSVRGRRVAARRRSTPCSPGDAPEPAETEPVGCSVKWSR